MKPIYPPRPKGRIPPAELPRYEKTGNWIAQYKYNGSRVVIHIDPDRRVWFFSRHGKPFQKFQPSAHHIEQVRSLPGLEAGKGYWLDGELLGKEEETKGNIVLFDVLQAGRYLYLNPDQMARFTLLHEICGSPPCPEGTPAFVPVTPLFALAPYFAHAFLDRFRDDHGPDVEGLMLRRKDYALDNFGQKEYETASLIRCRKEAKNYAY